MGCEKRRATFSSRARRIVSLSPAITETLFAIGAGADLVGVSDYCDFPEAARELPRTGTALTPNYEAIVRLGPTLILCEGAASAPKRELSALGVTRFIPWLTLEDVVASTRLLGALTTAAAQADVLATKLWDDLAVAEAPHGPRVLAVLGESPGKLSEIYFIKRNSIHGAALRAAGARNAVANDVLGVPRLSLEELLRLDPEAIIVLVATGSKRQGEGDAARDFRALEPLSASKNQRITVLESNAAFSEGPRILDLAEQLKKSLTQLFGEEPRTP
jgi:ABC-type Fe3+-hydroxamate transport system substrate-binding protein